MKNIMQAHADCSMEDALHIVCRAEEVSCMYHQYAGTTWR